MVTYAPCHARRRSSAAIGVVSPLGASRDGFVTGCSRAASRHRADRGLRRCPRAARTLGAPVSGFEPTTVDPADEAAAHRRDRALRDRRRRATRSTMRAFRTTRGGDDRIGVVLGTFSAGGQATSEYLDALKGGPAGAPALLFSSTVGNAPASLAGLEYNLRGPNMTLRHKEASGLAAIVFATHLLRRGKAHALVAGGADDIYERFLSRARLVRRDGGRRHAGRVSAVRSRRRAARLRDGRGRLLLVLEDEASASARGAGRAPRSSASSSASSGGDQCVAGRRCRAGAHDAAGDRGRGDHARATWTWSMRSANGTAASIGWRRRASARCSADAAVPVTSIKGAIGEFGAAGAGSAAAAILCGRQGMIAADRRLRRPPARTVVLAVSPVLRARRSCSSTASPGGALFSVVAARPVALIDRVRQRRYQFLASILRLIPPDSRRTSPEDPSRRTPRVPTSHAACYHQRFLTGAPDRMSTVGSDEQQSDPLSLAGRVALVTGGSRGIGRAIAEAAGRARRGRRLFLRDARRGRPRGGADAARPRRARPGRPV